MLPWLQMDKTINTRGMQLADNELALKVGGEFLDASFQSALGGATSEYRVNFVRDLKCLSSTKTIQGYFTCHGCSFDQFIALNWSNEQIVNFNLYSSYK